MFNHYFNKLGLRALDTALKLPRADEILDRALPFLKRALPLAENADPLDDVLARMGYDGDLLRRFSDRNVMVVRRSARGLLAVSAFLDEPSFPAMARAHKYKDNFLALPHGKYDANVYLMLPEDAEENWMKIETAEKFISEACRIPREYIENINADPRQFLLFILAHEITHTNQDLDMLLRGDALACLMSEIEADGTPHREFSEVSMNGAFDKILEEIRHARAVGAIMTAFDEKAQKVALQDRFVYATAPVLHGPVDFELPELLEAHIELAIKLKSVIDAESYKPNFMKIYKAAAILWNEDNALEPLERRILGQFMDGVEYFSPSYAALALKNSVPRPHAAPDHSEPG